ncbi:hypothetical protein ABK040_000454 [Willaertia magna]
MEEEEDVISSSTSDDSIYRSTSNIPTINNYSSSNSVPASPVNNLSSPGSTNNQFASPNNNNNNANGNNFLPYKLQKKGETYETLLDSLLRKDNPPLDEELRLSIPRVDSEMKFEQSLQEVEGKFKSNLSSQLFSPESPMKNDLASSKGKLFANKKEKKKRSMNNSAAFSNILGNDNVNYLEMYNSLKDKYDQLLIEHSRQQEVFQLRQETFMRREQRAKEIELELNDKMKEALTVRDSDDMENVRNLKDKIQDKINLMKNELYKLLETKENEFERKMEEMMRRFEKELMKERKKSTTGEREWREKSKSLKKELDSTVLQVLKLDERNNELIKENQKLKIQFAAQEDDRNLFAKHVAKEKREKSKLKEEVARLQQELESRTNVIKELHMVRQYSPSNSHYNYAESTAHSSLMQYSSNNDFEERERRLIDANNKLKRLLDSERKNIRQIRNQNIRILEERTELEIFLRSCIEDVKEEIKRKKTNEKIDLVEFQKKDRQRVMDILLSKEKVLRILYEKVFDRQLANDFEQDMQTLPLPSFFANPKEAGANENDFK